MIVTLISSIRRQGAIAVKKSAARANEGGAPRANPKARVRTPRGRLHPRCRTNRRHRVSYDTAYACVTVETNRSPLLVFRSDGCAEFFGRAERKRSALRKVPVANFRQREDLVGLAVETGNNGLECSGRSHPPEPRAHFPDQPPSEALGTALMSTRPQSARGLSPQKKQSPELLTIT